MAVSTDGALRCYVTPFYASPSLEVSFPYCRVRFTGIHSRLGGFFTDGLVFVFAVFNAWPPEAAFRDVVVYFLFSYYQPYPS